ncbi:hypothetical protein ACFFQW_34290 [Umezawaea endophytica]|uniref:Uncharacterized protein n=1 Tax=Umezawaea endophytica TaxID=1654476 RepID=A0A9X2VXC2_9PSEU|nr:hypothetical protein [Umezawaea endophytica]MCS7484400.1 hypothetical protein [Umezawaea endophytica]
MSANDSPRFLDRIMRAVRSTMRSKGLPRPDRLVISTRSRSVHMEFTSGTAPDRLAALLLWSTTLDGVSLAWTHQPRHEVSVAATGRTAAGISFGLAASATVADLDGHPGVDRGKPVVVLAGVFRLAPCVAESVTYEDVARLVHLGRSVLARRSVAAGVAA